MDVIYDLWMSLALLRVVCWQVELSASGRSLVQRIPTECGVSECDRVIMRSPWPTRSRCAMIHISPSTDMGFLWQVSMVTEA